MENKTDYSKPFLSQDDCAPDSMEYFLKAFEKHMGMTLSEFKSRALKYNVEEGYCSEWMLSHEGHRYILSIEAGDPYYKLYKTEINA